MASPQKITFENHLIEGTLDSLTSEDFAFHKLRTILNKITLENYQRLGDRLVLWIKNVALMKEAITYIFAKAGQEPNLGFVYVDLLAKLTSDASEVAEGEHVVTFYSLVINKCQEELDEIAYFATHNYQEERFDAVQVEPDEVEEIEVEENELERRRHLLGLIKFVGGLFVSGFLQEKHITPWIQVLLGDINNPIADHIEVLCTLLKAIGSHVNDEPDSLVSECFERLSKLSKDPKLPTSIRFAVLDVLELRNSQWMPIVPNAKFCLCSSGT